MKIRFLFMVLFVLLSGISAKATTVTIQSTTISNWRFPGTTAQLRIYLRTQMVTSDSFVRLPGSPSGGLVYGQYTCTVAGGVLTIPTVTIDSTTDALVGSNATYSAYFFNSANGAQLAPYAGFGNFMVPNGSATTTWSNLLIYNSTNVPVVDDRSYNRTQIDALIQSTAGAPIASPFLTTTAAASLSGATNLGALPSGLLKISVSGGVATPAVAVAGTDYLIAASLNSLNASNLTSGTVDDNRLSANVTLLGSTIDVSGSEIVGILKSASFPALTGDVTTSAGAVATTITVNSVSDAKLRQSAGLSIVGRAANSTGNVADITAGADFQILRRNGTSIAFGSVDLSQSAAVGSSILSLFNGGTGSATKNFIDLTNPQTANGNKILTGFTTLGVGSYTAASPSLVNQPVALLVTDSTSGSPTTSLVPTAAFETWRTGNGTTIVYPFVLRKSAGEGEVYNVFVDGLWNPNMTGFTTDVNHVNLRSDFFMLPTNNNNNRQIVGYSSWLRAGRGMPAGGAQALDVANMRAVAVQADAWNNSPVQADFDAATINSTIGIAINTEPGLHNSVAVYIQAASAASAYSVGILPSPNGLYRYGLDMSSMTFAFAGNVSTTANTIIGDGSAIFLTEAQIGDQVKVNNAWYTVTARNSNSNLSVTPDPGVQAGPFQMTKTVIPMRLANQSYITAQTNTPGTNYRLVGFKSDDTWSFDPDGRTSSFGGDVIVYNNASPTNKTIIKTLNSAGTYYPGIWFGSATPSISNFGFLSDSGITILNGTSLAFRVGNAAAWGIDTSRNLIASTDNSYDIGASGATRPRTLYLGTSLSIAGGTALTTTNQTGTPGALVLSNSPTIVTPTVASFVNANHNHTNSAGGGQLSLSAFSSVTGSGAAVGATSPSLTTPDIGVATGTSISLGGNVTLTGTARRFIADMSNATISNRFGFQSASGNTVMSVIPSSGATVSAVRAFNNSDVDNAGLGGLIVTTGAVSLESGITGSGTLLPVTITLSGAVALRADGNKNVALGGNVAAGTSAVSVVVIPNGTPPSTSTVDAIQFYAQDVAASSELKVRDEAGNITTLSPHNFSGIPRGRSEDMAWSFYSERNDQFINVDMLKVIRLLEKLTGEKLVFTGKLH